MIRKLIISTLAVLWIFQAVAQRAQGSWQDYLSYASAVKIALSPTKVFCATTGGLMYYDLEDNSVNKFSTIAELSDFGIKTIAYSEENNVLVIAYNNCNIDLIYGTQVFNLTDIKRKQISGDKTINNISFVGSEAYFSTSFGIVVLNLDKREIKDTYFIGDGGSSIVVNDVTADDNYLYAATNNGILKADRTGSNLLDYHNWSRIEDIPHADQKFNHLINHQGRIIANYTPGEWFNDAMYILNGTSWDPYQPLIRYVFDMQENGKDLAIASREQLFIVDENDNVVQRINEYILNNKTISPINPQSVGIYSNGNIWIADYVNSLVKVSGNNYESGFLVGPLDNTVFSLNYSGSGLWVTPGGTRGFEIPRFERFEDNQWVYFAKDNHPELDGDLFRNIVKIAVDPKDASHFFVASWGGGLLEYKNDEFVHRYTNLNSPLETALPQQPNEPYVRIGGLDFDPDGNLWITNAESSKALHKLAPDGEWESFNLSEIGINKALGPVIVTQNEDKWVVVSRGFDAYVVNKTGEQKKRLLVTSYFNNGENEIFNRMNDIFSIVEDNEGAIWIGTTKGVAVYTNPSRIWDSESFYAIQPSLDLNDGLYHPLLETETVTAIAVDGANRKWLGTQNSGVYLVSASGDKEIMHFTSENSPLLSNTITAITINQDNGEVFFGTDEGLISYLGEAIGGKDSYANVYVYPNPVRETYDGPVTVTGLKENTEVKITDISGNLVFRTKSLGGQAVWDGKNLNGNRVKTGVYLVLCNDESGEETHISKLLFIH